MLAAVPMVHGMLTLSSAAALASLLMGASMLTVFTVLTFTALAAVIVMAMVFFVFPHISHLLSSF